MKGFPPETATFSDQRDKLAYIIGSMGKDLVFGILTCCLFLYCTQELKFNSSFLGVLFFANIVIGIVLAPVVGYLLDHTYTRFGKYKPWVIGSAIVNLIALAIFYYLPQYGMSAGDRILYVSAVYTLWSISFLMLDIPTWSMLSLFNTNNTTRDVMSQVPNFTQIVGKQIFIIFTLPLLEQIQSWLHVDTSTYSSAIISCILILVVSQLLFVLLLHPNYNHHLLLRASIARTMSAQQGIRDNEQGSKLQGRTIILDDTGASFLANSNFVSFKEKEKSNLLQSFLRLFMPLHGLNSVTVTSSFTPASGTSDSELSTQQESNRTQDPGLLDLRAFNSTLEEGKISVPERHGHNRPFGNMRSVYTSSFTVSGNEASATGNFWGKAPEQEKEAKEETEKRSFIRAQGRKNSTTATLSPSSSAIVQADLARYEASALVQNNPFNVRAMVQMVTRNDQLLVVFLSTFLLYSIYGLIFGGFFSLFLERLSSDLPSIFTIIVLGLITHLLSVASFESLVRRTSRKVLFNLSLALMLLGFTTMLFLQNARVSEFFLPMLFASYICSCTGMGLSKVAITAMTIDTVDYGEFKLSVRSDGLIFGLRNVAYKLGELVGFFYYSNAIFTFFGQTPYNLGLSFNLNLAVILVIIMLLLTGLIYMHLYKLNGAFYRNVLNNLQYLKHNQRWYSHSPTTNRFMLRYALDESTMIIKLKAKNLDDIVRAMVQKLSDVNAITSEHDYMVDLKKRLRQGACGIAEGIALPHAKSSAVRRATVVVATLDTPLDLGALDGRKCDLIFLLASPDDGFTHLNLLGRLSLLLNEPNFADKLRASGSPTELFERLVQCEKHLVR